MKCANQTVDAHDGLRICCLHARKASFLAPRSIFLLTGKCGHWPEDRLAARSFITR